MSDRLLAETAFGIAIVDAESGELLALEAGPALPRRTSEGLGLPLLVDVARHGSRVVAVLERRPPVAVSDDAGATWREAGGGLPALVAVAIADDHPDRVAVASRERLFVSSDGGRFWHALPVELEAITALAWEPGVGA